MKPRIDAYLLHIRDAIEVIGPYVTSHTYEQFLKSPWDQAAVARHLETIGEAATQIAEDFKKKHEEIPWRKISDFRNVLVHEYFAIDPILVWEILQKDMPILKKQSEALIGLIQ